MGKVFPSLDPSLVAWIRQQPLFFVGTAPLAADGHVNVSPKGPIGTLAVLDDRTVAYLDMVGSGAETIAHLRENGRIVLMLCAFHGPPRIVRLHGRGRAVPRDDAGYDALAERCAFEDGGVPEARRAIVVVELTRIADSCGYGVPRMRYEAERPQLTAWAEKKLAAGGPEEIRTYMRKKNATSLDGLPALDLPRAKK